MHGTDLLCIFASAPIVIGVARLLTRIDLVNDSIVFLFDRASLVQDSPFMCSPYSKSVEVAGVHHSDMCSVSLFFCHQHIVWHVELQPDGCALIYSTQDTHSGHVYLHQLTVEVSVLCPKYTRTVIPNIH
jgi:hypothetical protein